jgi:hypothetical protein
MKRLALATLFFFTSALVTAPQVVAAQGQSQAAQKKNDAPFAIPIVGSGAGGTFTGTFALQKFAADAGRVVALGTITGIVTDAGGVSTSILRNVSVPVTVGGADTTAAVPGVVAQATCPILHLDLGPLNLDLLGLQIDLSRIVLDITAVSGAGNLLGNLLCAVVGLLDNPSGLADLLNRILDILR